ncbi:PH-domain-containing protein [Amylocystis lapponica]|nr:PH-domain-containing protein [Amylocystis lapponica]
MSRSVPPPSQAEITRKLSVKSPPKKPTIATVPVSGTESDSDSMFSPDAVAAPAAAVGATLLAVSSSQPPPLSSIAERRSHSGEESEEDEEDEDGGWRVEDTTRKERGSLDETVLKTGYLWKKGERRKTWKKRWFVLRPAHLAFYKTSAEYKLLRLLDLSEIHSCTAVALKKHQNTFGLVSPVRTFYLQAGSLSQVQEWVVAVNEARTALLATSTQNSVTSPVPIPNSTSASRQKPASNVSSSPSHSPYGHQLTSSESDDGSPAAPHSVPRSIAASTPAAGDTPSPSKSGAAKESPKVILSGYLMKCGSRRHNWHKRWFILSGEKLLYYRSHMDPKPHREIPLELILDALEYDLPSHRPNASVSPPPIVSPPQAPSSAADEAEGGQGTHTFKVVTTKRTLLLCAPSEEEEIKWLSAVRALIARRSGQGVVPGDAAAAVSPSSKQGAAIVSPVAEIPGQVGNMVPSAPGPGAGTVAGAGRRRDSIARRLSLSGGTAFASVGPQEPVSERQS